MATGAGVDAQLGVAVESVYGTYTATGMRFYELVSESMKLNVARIVSQAIRTGRRTHHRWKPGARSVSGDIVIELVPQDLGQLWRNVQGDPVTTGSDPYTHTFTGLGTIDTKSMSIQVGRPDEGGTVRAFSYVGCKFTSVKLSAAVNEFVKATFSVYGQNEDTAQTLATATYDAEYNPFVFTEASLNVAGSNIPVKSFDFSMDLKLATDRHRVTATAPGLPRKALVSGIADISGSFTADFTDLVQYNRYVNATESALVLAFDNGVDSKLTITLNVRYDGETPTVNNAELLELPQQFVATSPTSDGATITTALVNSDATP